jgi:4-aminobutyrate aminotransferase/(S)-3-amino-2-methylpropionate transaminase
MIHRVTEIPGPKSRALLERRAAAITKGLGKSTDVVVERAEGALVYDVDGNTLIDLAGGIGMTAAGHCPPAVVAAIEAQAKKLLHPCMLVATYEPYIALCELLNEVTPGDFPKKSILANSGAEAVENAIKIARVATGREWIIAFQNSFHGRTYAAMTATGKTKNSRMAFMRSTTPNIAHLPYPYPYRPIANVSEEELAELHVRLFEQVLETNLAPEHVAAVIIEPVQGEGGFVVPPARFLKRIAAICRRHDILFIADEIQTGMARTGRMFAVEHVGVTPDLLITSKSLGAGFPIGAVTGRAELFDALGPGTLGSTFGGHPIACVAVLKTIEIIERDHVAERATAIGVTLRARFDAIASRSANVGEARGIGAMQAIELVRDRATKKPAPELVEAAIKRACERGLLLLRAGLYSNVIRTLVPLTITDAQLGEGLDILEGSLDG